MNLYRKNKISKERLVELQSLKMEDSEIMARMKSPHFRYLIDSIVEFFVNSGGINYVAFSAWHKKLGEFDITIQRREGKTVTEINAELKKEIEELKIKLSNYGV